jgi:ankyrin repeat protein
MSFDTQAAGNLPWEYQVNMFEYHRTRVTADSRQLDRTEIIESSCFLFFCYLQGIGTSIDKSAATRHLLRSAESGDPVSRAVSYRAIVGFSESLPNSIPEKDIAQWLCRSIEMGCFGAKDDFQHLIASQNTDTAATLKRWYQVAISRLRCFTAGVGAGHFLDDRGNRLNPFSIEKMESFEVEIARLASGDGFDINDFALNIRGDSLLHFASTCGFREALNCLIQNFGKALNINAINKDGETALLSATRAGQTETVRILLANGADLRPSTSGENPLHWLAMFDLEDIPELALSMVQIPMATNSGANHTETRRLWLQQKASATKWSIYWGSELPPGTPLHRAVHFKNLELVKSLLDLGADPLEPSSDADGQSAIEMACAHHQAGILEVMLDKLGIADVNNIPVQPLLHLALLSHDNFASFVVNGVNLKVDVLKTLLLLSSRGANPGLRDARIPGSNVTSTALFNAVLSKSQQSVELALSGALLTSPDLLNARCGEELLTPLHMAVQRGSLPMVKSLLDSGSDPTVASGSGLLSTLHFCATMDPSSPHSRDIFNRLSPFYDNVDQSHDGGETPFAKAVRLLKFDLAIALLDKGANVDFEFSRGDEDMIINSPTTILGLLVQQMNPGGLAAVQFLLGYDRNGRKKADWKYRLPSPIVNTRDGLTVFHAIALRRRKPFYAVGTVKEMMSYVSETYGKDLALVNQRSAIDSRPTALHIAAHCTNIEVVASLFRIGAGTDVVDDNDFTPVKNALAVMTEDLDIDEGQGWTETSCRSEIQRRKAVYEMLGGNMDVFETTDVDDLAVITH